MIDPEPVVYEQATIVYTEPVVDVISEPDLQEVNDYDNLTETPSPSEGVFAIQETVIEPVECRCVQWLRDVKGYNVKGDAHTIQPNTDKPFVHGVVIQEYDGVTHVSGIKYIMLDRILVEESNFEKCTPTERVIMLDDPHIVGFYFKNPN